MQLVEFGVWEAVAFLEFPRAVLRDEEVGEPILDAFDRKRFKACRTPPGAVVPQIST